MTAGPRKILVIQTAFIGDVLLTLPLVQLLHEQFRDSQIDFIAVPAGASVLANHPALHEIIVYDKRGRDTGPRGILQLAGSIRGRGYEVAFVPHRSLRSALLAWLGRIPRRIGFSTSAGRLLFTDVVPYRHDEHEVDRDLSLLRPLGISSPSRLLPIVHPGTHDRELVDTVLAGFMHQRAEEGNAVVAIAPGSVWATKRWLKERFISLIRILVSQRLGVVLIGSRQDAELCSEIEKAVNDGAVINVSGKLTLLQSAEVIRRCALLVSNDSAPMHLGVSVQTPVVAIFGPTVPRFGFAPLGPLDRIVERQALSCRPCSIHGSRECPITTFDCMKLISPEEVFSQVRAILSTGRKFEEHVGGVSASKPG